MASSFSLPIADIDYWHHRVLVWLSRLEESPGLNRGRDEAEAGALADCASGLGQNAWVFSEMYAGHPPEETTSYSIWRVTFLALLRDTYTRANNLHAHPEIDEATRLQLREALGSIYDAGKNITSIDVRPPPSYSPQVAEA